jgi:hypothetical protein
MTPEQRETFEETGLLRLPGAVAPPDVDAMRERVWRALRARHGFREEDPATWTTWRPSKLKGEIERAGGFPELGCPALVEVLDALFGPGGWQPPDRWGVPILTFPTPGPWEVPHRFWHVDLPVSDRGEALRTVVVLTLLARVEPRGGGTAAVAGSSRLLRALCASGEIAGTRRSIDVRRKLQRIDPWFRLLFEGEGEDRERRLRDGTSVRGVELELVEVTGGPGDVVVMHPWTLHSLSPNEREEPRLALSSHVHALPAPLPRRPAPARRS